MARLQDFQSVTPQGTDNLLIVQAAGQGLATIATIASKIFGLKTASDLKLNSSSGSPTTAAAIASKANTADLAAVATSGSYNDLSNKPTIDSSVSTSSTNAVQNKAITSFVNNQTRRYVQLWGTSCQSDVGRIHWLVMVNDVFYIVWFGGTNDVRVRNVGTNTLSTGSSGRATLDNITFARTDLQLKVTATQNVSISIIG